MPSASAGCRLTGLRVALTVASMKTIALIFQLLPFASTAGLVEKAVSYKEGDAELEGFHVYDDGVEGKRPAVLIIHQWTGLTDNEKRRACMLAEMGYNVFAADIYVPADEIEAFWKEMESAEVDWQLITYPGAVHSFTQEMAGDDPSKGAAYDKKADEPSWEDMKEFFAVIFGG